MLASLVRIIILVALCIVAFVVIGALLTILVKLALIVALGAIAYYFIRRVGRSFKRF